MSPQQARLQQLLERLRELESRQPEPHERAIVEASRMALCDEVSRIAHAMHDADHWRAPATDAASRARSA